MTDQSLASIRRPSTPEAELAEAIAEDEARLGRPLTPRELEAFAHGFFAKEYREEIRRLMALGVEDDA